MIILYHGGDSNLEYLKELSGTTSKGTSMLGLAQASANFGLKAEVYSANLENLRTISSPFILHVTSEFGHQHFVTCFGFKKNKYIIGDPAFGIRLYTDEELSDIWKDGYLLLVKKTKDFKLVNQKRTPQISWLFSVIKEDTSFYLSAIFMGIIIALLNMATLIYTEKLIDVIIPKRDLFLLVKSSIIWGVIMIIGVLFVYIRSHILIKQAFRFNTRVVSFFFKNLLLMPKIFFDSKKTGDMISRMNDTARIQKNIKTIIADSLIDCFVLCIAITFLFYYSSQVAFIVLTAIPVLGICSYLFSNSIQEQQHKMFTNYAITESNYIDTISGIEAIKSFSKENYFYRQNNTIYSKFQKSILKLLKYSIDQDLVIQLTGTLLNISAVFFAVIQTVEKSIQLGELIAIILLTNMAIEVIMSLVNLNLNFIESGVAIERMFDFSQRSKTIEKSNQNNLKVISEEINRLDIRNLNFSYPGQEDLITEVNFSMQKGEISFLNGESGNGKSTIAQLLLKFYAPKSGEIILNNKINLKDVNLDYWREVTGYVPQNIKIFNNSLHFNISLEENEKSKVLTFCKKEPVFEGFFSRFVDSFDTIFGEEGVNPSGGEKQIIAIARALYSKPKILILDEPTSWLDQTNQLRILKILNNLSNKMLILLITHKHEILKGQRIVYTLENKKIFNQKQ